MGLHKLLTSLAKRRDEKNIIWYNCSLTPKIGDEWNCYVCGKTFLFEKSILEIDNHGFSHLQESNLLPFM